jgi:3-dehydroquinate dehydratase-2
MKVLIIHGPNLNLLGQRQPAIYGKKTLREINELITERAKEMGVDVITFQSNSEGEIIDFLQQRCGEAQGIIINPGALTHYSFSLREALAESGLPIIEVHLSNIYSREEWRAKSVIAPITKGQISGLGWRGYIFALEFLVHETGGKAFT